MASRTPAKENVQKSITSTEESGVVARENAAKQKAKAEADRQAAEEAQKQEAYNKTKKSYGDLLGSGGKGNTGKPGSQGDPNGDPNSNVLEGISKGSGRVGGGLGNRGVLHEPSINDRSQKTGRVVISVCVDKTGKVIKAEYTQKGSTTTDSELKDIAKKAAQQFKFTTSEIEEQCGTITVDFKVRG
jgi:TonB family protein